MVQEDTCEASAYQVAYPKKRKLLKLSPEAIIYPVFAKVDKNVTVDEFVDDFENKSRFYFNDSGEPGQPFHLFFDPSGEVLLLVETFWNS